MTVELASDWLIVNLGTVMKHIVQEIKLERSPAGCEAKRGFS